MGSTTQGEEPKYNLRWQDYPQSVVSSFRHLRENEDFVDVTLACNSQQFTAHKVVLSACSPYFRKLLKSNPCQHPIVILRDITEADLKALLKFMYHGEVQVSEDRLQDFLKTAETLQVRGLAESCATAVQGSALNGANDGANPEHHTSRSNAIRRRRVRRRDREAEGGDRRVDTDDEEDRSGLPAHNESTKKNSGRDEAMEEGETDNESRRDSDGQSYRGLSVKRFRAQSGDHVDDGCLTRSVSPNSYRHNDTYHNSIIDERKENNNMSKESLLSQALEKPLMAPLGGFGLRSGSDGHDDSGASDTGSERPESMVDMKSDTSELHRQLSSPAAMAAAAQAAAAGLFPPGLEALYRQAGFPSAFLGLGHHSPGSGPGGLSLPGMGHPPQQGGLQSHSNNPTIGGKLDMMRIRATDPRPCPKCGKIYRSAHTLRTHMEDKHTVCPGYRCVLCGTVAKSRNSLHSHMSRQHRGISTKDLPVVPMPAPFDAELASRLLAKAGVKVSPNELAARASPTAPRRSDIPKLDSNLLNLHSSQQFPLPASGPGSSATVMLHGRAINTGGSEAEDLRVPNASPFGHSLAHMRSGLNHKDFGGGAHGAAGSMGSALLDTYLSMIAAAGGDNNMAAALNSFPAGRAAAFAAAAQAAASGRRLGRDDLGGLNGDGKDVDGRSISDRDRDDEAGELGSDADISDTEDNDQSKDEEDETN